jgi:hypothetical protein
LALCCFSGGSFPSGHTIAGFSVATVVSRRYGKKHRWVPDAAYGMAALVGASRERGSLVLFDPVPARNPHQSRHAPIPL